MQYLSDPPFLFYLLMSIDGSRFPSYEKGIEAKKSPLKKQKKIMTQFWSFIACWQLNSRTTFANTWKGAHGWRLIIIVLKLQLRHTDGSNLITTKIFRSNIETDSHRLGMLFNGGFCHTLWSFIILSFNCGRMYILVRDFNEVAWLKPNF